MSGVPERLRNLSEREFYNNAIELRVEVLGIITSSAIPKSQRFTFAVPMAETARSVVYNIVKSEAFYPNTPENVAARKRYLTLAVADCEQLYQDAQAYLEVYRRKGDTQHAGGIRAHGGARRLRDKAAQGRTQGRPADRGAVEWQDVVPC